MKSKTAKLFGDGRHPVGIKFTFDGESYRLRFVGPDRAVDVLGVGRDIPIGMAEYLRNFPGTGIYFSGGAPADAGVFEDKVASVEDDDSPRRGEGQTNAQMQAPSGKKWPSMSMSKDELVRVCLSAGAKKNDLDGLNKSDLVELGEDILTKKFPAWAEQQRGE